MESSSPSGSVDGTEGCSKSGLLEDFLPFLLSGITYHSSHNFSMQIFQEVEALLNCRLLLYHAH